jgi:hypothetical protein
MARALPKAVAQPGAVALASTEGGGAPERAAWAVYGDNPGFACGPAGWNV